MSKRNRIPEERLSPFLPLLLFLVLCILLAITGILREYRKDRTVGPVIGRLKLPIIKKKIIPREKTGKLQIAFIIDDVGWNKDIIKEIEEINRPLTLSFLPKAPYSKDIFEAMRKKDEFELILHLPLEPNPPAQSYDKGLIKTKMTDEEIIKQFNEDIKGYYPHIRGLNNHMGSSFTSDEEKMRILMEELREKRLFFVDSLTAKQSKGYTLAKEMGIKTAQRDIFIDNDSSPEYIQKQVKELVEISRKQGKAIGIGHARRNTISVLKNIIPEIEKEGVEIVPVSSLLE